MLFSDLSKKARYLGIPLFIHSSYLFILPFQASPLNMILPNSLGAVISGCHFNFQNPVSLSKKIMYESPHCALSGDGTLEFATEKKILFVIPKTGHIPEGQPPTKSNSLTQKLLLLWMPMVMHLACAASTRTCKVAFVNICFLETWKPCNNVIN